MITLDLSRVGAIISPSAAPSVRRITPAELVSFRTTHLFFKIPTISLQGIVERKCYIFDRRSVEAMRPKPFYDQVISGGSWLINKKPTQVSLADDKTKFLSEGLSSFDLNHQAFARDKMGIFEKQKAEIPEGEQVLPIAVLAYAAIDFSSMVKKERGEEREWPAPLKNYRLRCDETYPDLGRTHRICLLLNDSRTQLVLEGIQDNQSDWYVAIASGFRVKVLEE